MKKSIFVALFALVGLTTALLFAPWRTTSSQKGDVRRSSDPIPNRYIVVLDESVIGSDAVEPEVAARGEFLSSIHGARMGRVYSNALKGFVAEMTPEQAEAMNADPSVRFIEEDAVVSVSAEQTNAPWHLDRVDQRNAPLNTIYGYASNGAGVHIYIIDTGIRYTHNEFGGRANVFYDNIGDGQNGNDCHGHGTHVAGIAVSATYGVAKGASPRCSSSALQRQRVDLRPRRWRRLADSPPRESGCRKHKHHRDRKLGRARGCDRGRDRVRDHLYRRRRQQLAGRLRLHACPHSIGHNGRGYRPVREPRRILQFRFMRRHLCPGTRCYITLEFE
jgi:Peptidase inhibitor I9/Subtilase family